MEFFVVRAQQIIDQIISPIRQLIDEADVSSPHMSDQQAVTLANPKIEGDHFRGKMGNRYGGTRNTSIGP